MSIGKWSWLSMGLTVFISFAWLNPVHADEQSSATASSNGTDLGEIVVTARKRQESILNVPVDEQVIPGLKLEQMQLTEITDLPQITPGLQFGHSLLSIGTLVSIRGIGSSATASP
jgi:iron complex outermembrane receptor protein